MDILHTFFLALLQGLTEFLPISSSAHLILLPKLAEWKDQGLAFDVAVHVGTLIAVATYFRHELIKMTYEWSQSLITRKQTTDSRLAWGIIFGTIPVGLCGLLFKDVVETTLRTTEVIAATTIVFALLLWWADRKAKHVRDEHTLTVGDIFFIGVAQAIALIPGTSRSGITITAGLMLGLTRQAAARFSFLLSIPVIILAGGLSALDLIQDEKTVDWSTMVAGAFISGVSAYFTIHFFLKLLERIGMMPFVIYRIFLGLILLVI